MTQNPKRISSIARRAEQLEAASDSCIVLGCRDATRAASREGLDRRLCRKHYEHYQRHGSPFRSSYTAEELKAHRQAVRQWLRADSDRPEVKQAIARVDILYRSAGPAEPAYRLKGLSPRERARKAWARLREASVPPEKVVAAWLTVQRTITNDPEADTKPEFARVQAAKLIHRLASGTRKTWEQRDANDRLVRIERLEVYPRSRGRVLREIGKDIEAACEGLEQGLL